MTHLKKKTKIDPRLKSTFDPTNFNFNPVTNFSAGEIIMWETVPQPDYALIGSYSLNYNVEDDWWNLSEVIYHNDIPKDIPLYSGKIPDNEWGFQLLKNMDMILPVIQRENKIEDLFD